MDNLLKEMGSRIYGRRKQLGLTQEELAERSGLTPQNVSTAELGKKALRPENIIKICRALEMSTDYLLLGEISSADQNLMFSKVSRLSCDQFRYLEEVVNIFIEALTER